MFEKVAKEWVRTNSGYSTKEFHGQKAIEAFLAGAEFGYNKAFVEADKNLKAIVTDFNKAKEIIKEMLSILPKENIEGIYEITEEAEHFLREVEK